ncbi:MAG: hypothetical protein KBB55_03085 [Candidatus Buchananbacteria bacterium]|nr:hypothetical protein [Candidatus Buchananbacteria bacterium]
MFNTTQDIFWFAAAIATFGIGITLTIFLIYAIFVLRDVKIVTTSARRKLEIVDQILTVLKAKVEVMAAVIPAVTEGVINLAGSFGNGKKKK